jgi:hypothetical protein
MVEKKNHHSGEGVMVSIGGMLILCQSDINYILLNVRLKEGA